FEDGDTWVSETTNEHLVDLNHISPENNPDLKRVLQEQETYNEKMTNLEDDSEIMVIGIPILNKDGAVYVYQSLDVINQTKAETTKIIFVAAAIAIVLTTVFAFFLSTRITAPLIQMREAAIDLTRGEFNK